MPLAGVLASLIFFGCGLKQEAAEPEQIAYVWIPKKVYFTYVCCYNTASFPRAIGEPDPGENSMLSDDNQSTSFSCSKSPREKGSGTKAAPTRAVPICAQVSTSFGSSLLTGHGHRIRLLGSSSWGAAVSLLSTGVSSVPVHPQAAQQSSDGGDVTLAAPLCSGMSQPAPCSHLPCS